MFPYSFARTPAITFSLYCTYLSLEKSSSSGSGIELNNIP